MAFELPPLPYAYNALEPYIDEMTMRLHHDKHHATYVNNLNAALAKHPELQPESLAELLRNINAVPEDIRTAVRNHGGGHANHTLFWEIMKPQGGGEPVGALAEAINRACGSFARLKEDLSQKAIAVFGSGWGWLSVGPGGALRVHSAPNQDSPLMEGWMPILGVDVWEHAYYLKYQNRRADYVAAWWNTLNWENVAQRYERALKGL
ncbi:MAG: superoxide dismutase [Chloroflexi bacterium]|nr:superoxide dismutase [Chloroflexota bacterium]